MFLQPRCTWGFTTARIELHAQKTSLRCCRCATVTFFPMRDNRCSLEHLTDRSCEARKERSALERIKSHMRVPMGQNRLGWPDGDAVHSSHAQHADGRPGQYSRSPDASMDPDMSQRLESCPFCRTTGKLQEAILPNNHVSPRKLKFIGLTRWNSPSSLTNLSPACLLVWASGFKCWFCSSLQ